MCSFARDLAVNAVGGFVAGAIVLALGYLVVEKRLQLEDQASRTREREAGDAHRRRAALQVLRLELLTNAQALHLALQVVGAGRVSFPLFSATSVRVAFEPSIFTTLRPATIEALLHVDSRMQSANELHALLFDLTQGRTFILAALSAAPEDPSTSEVYQRVLQHRERFRKALIQRCENLAPHLHAAIDAVEADLDITGLPPAAERDFRPTQVGLIGHASEHEDQV